MIYYTMESNGHAQLPAITKEQKAEVIIVSDLSQYREIDYDDRSELISERLKNIIWRYMPNHVFQPVIYLNTNNNEQAIYWRFKPPVYCDLIADFRNDGIVSHISFPSNHAPIVFSVLSPKGKRSIIVRVAVAESVLRRGVSGLRFTEVAV